MAIPVISASSSILGYKRNEVFEFQPAATNSPVRWEATGLPNGITIDSHSEKACTGAAATDTITCAAHGYANGDRVWFPSLTGGGGLVSTPTPTTYYVRDKATDTFKVAATAGGAAVDITTDISAGAVRKVSSGKLSGAATTAGVYVVTLTATNTAGETSTGAQFVIGIASESAGATATGDAAADWTVDVVSRAVAATGSGAAGGAGSAAGAATLATWKEGDVVMLALKFTKDGEVVDPSPATVKLTIKELEPDGVLVEADDFEKIGSDAAAYFNLPVDLTGSALAGALSNYEADAGTGFDALCEIEWTLSVTHKSSPLTLRYSSQTFRVRIERDLGDN